ncbi:hypothetical protein EX30DRAFT_327342 [Ascodesmis nigricans]|uniref:L-lactate dehydrogenase (cytochrome) n=1 Tax=Ascodesmis nigricans TaxID=341454 RepID=A0A4V3SJE8_9PEZI|nr:hypothetical protein EX30DRAFT_327342 [Ascodesmis nigricans]
MAPTRKISATEVAKHTSPNSCWVILHSNVYDVTPLLTTHPGGPTAILTHAGTDASAIFDSLHPSDTLSELPPQCLLGPVDKSTLPSSALDRKPAPTSTLPASSLPPLSHQLNLDNFEKTAEKVLSEKAWAYYSSSANDGETLRLNREIYRSILLRQRVFRDVSAVDTGTTLLGQRSSLPVFISPAAAARLAHPDGEAAICRAAGKEGVIQCVSNNASMTVEEISAARDTSSSIWGAGGQNLWWQLYLQVDRSKSAAFLHRISQPSSGYTAVILTLDAPWPGKREADERASLPPPELEMGGSAGAGVGKQLFAGTESSITWQDLEWVREHTHLPIILKGIQTHQDAAIAARNPLVKGIMLSNHGGRALDTAPPAVLVLLEIRKHCPWVLQKIEVYVDGGIRRGADVVKCLALGARAVGIGRPALYSLAGYGEEGVRRMLQILRDEVETALRLVGVGGVEDVEGWKGWGEDGEGVWDHEKKKEGGMKVKVREGVERIGEGSTRNGEGVRGRVEYVNTRRVDSWIWEAEERSGGIIQRVSSKL